MNSLTLFLWAVILIPLAYFAWCALCGICIGIGRTLYGLLIIAVMTWKLGPRVMWIEWKRFRLKER